MQHLLRLILCGLALVAASPLSFSSESELQPQTSLSLSTEPVSVTLIGEHQSLQPGQPTWVAIRMSIEKDWHAYWKNPGDAGMAPIINWNLPSGFEVSQLHWPTPKAFNLSSAMGLGYEGEVIFLAQITPPASFAPTANLEISAEMRWVVCSNASCLPGDAQLSLSLPVTAEAAQLDNRWKDLFNTARTRIPKKHEALSAQRTNNVIELTFNDLSGTPHTFQEAFFFPEHKKTIDYACPVGLAPSIENPKQHTLTLQEVESSATKAASLKGVLVLNTSSSSEAYDVDIQIEDQLAHTGVISMNSNPTYAVGSRAASISPAPAADHNFEFQGGLALALVFAFLGGMILNLMPCVLPVISLKVLSFVKLAGESRTLIFRHGVAFSLGVLLSFWVLAGALLALQAYGRTVGWGFQLQEPIFVAILASGLLIFALSLFGLFEMGTSLISAVGGAPKKEGLFGSFLSGILATAVATPCTGPFLGSAVGFAVTLPAAQAMLIFTSLGLGMSLPYLILAAFPSLLRFMPKAGNWMMAFKELMGFFMLATVLWLVWIFGAQTNNFALTLLLAGFFFMALACWIFGRWSTPLSSRLTRSISMLVAAAIFSCGGYAVIAASSSWAESMGSPSNANTALANDDWEEFSVERVEELRQQGIPVFIDFTAKWCLICQTNHLVLTSNEVTQQFNTQGVVKMKADWTKNDSTIAAELRKFGRNSVPLYVLYSGDAETQPQILPQLLTPEIVIQSLEQLPK